MASRIIIIDEKLSKVKHYTFESHDQNLCTMCSKPRTTTGSKLGTLVCLIDVHVRLLILRKKSPLHGLILVCAFIDFEKKFPPARLFYPARLLVLVCMYEHTSCKIKFEVCIRQVFGHKISKTVF